MYKTVGFKQHYSEELIKIEDSLKSNNKYNRNYIIPQLDNKHIKNNLGDVSLTDNLTINNKLQGERITFTDPDKINQTFI